MIQKLPSGHMKMENPLYAPVTRDNPVFSPETLDDPDYIPGCSASSPGVTRSIELDIDLSMLL